MVGGQKPTLENSVDKNRIASLRLYNVNSTDNNQPWKERPTLAGIPTRVHSRFPGLTL